MGDWFRSYANHILHCSLYTGIAAYSFKCASKASSTRTTSTSPSWTISWEYGIPLLVGAVAVRSLYSEIRYIFMRVGLPPGDSGNPIYGHYTALTSGHRIFNTQHVQKYGDPCVRNILMNPSLYLCDDEDIQWAITQERKGNIKKASYTGHSRDLFGTDSIFMESAANHKRLRRIFEPSFSPKATNDYVQKMDDTIKETFKQLSGKCDFSSAEDWAVLAMRVFFVCAFGKIEEDLLFRFQQLIGIWVAGFSTKLPLRNVPGTRLNKAFAARKELGTIFKNMIEDFKAKNPVGSPGAETTLMGRMCYSVDDDGKPLPDEQLVSNLLFMVFAGHDTTRGSFSAFLHFLTEHPELRALLIEEAKSFPFDEPLDPVKLKAAPLLNAFLAETWRVVPPSEGHHMEAATDLEYKGYKIRKGTKITADVTCDGVINEDRFPDPLEFRVERWLPQDHPMYNPKYFLEKVDYNVMSVKYRTFGFGSHMCLGGHFAKLESRVFLTRLLQSYNFEIRNNRLIQSPFLQYTNEFKLTIRQK